MELIQPESIKNYSLDLVVNNAQDYSGRINPATATGVALRYGAMKRPIIIGIHINELEPVDLSELVPTNIGLLNSFLESDVSQQLLREYTRSNAYPYDCMNMSIRTVEKLADFGIDALIYSCRTHERFRASSDEVEHTIALVSLESDNSTDHWLIDFSADQHIGLNPSIENVFLSRSMKKLKNIIQKHNTQSTPLVGPINYFSDLYIF